jgi:hypothetical protein
VRILDHESAHVPYQIIGERKKNLRYFTLNFYFRQDMPFQIFSLGKFNADDIIIHNCDVTQIQLSKITRQPKRKTDPLAIAHFDVYVLCNRDNTVDLSSVVTKYISYIL